MKMVKFYEGLDNFLCFDFLRGFGIFANQPIVHSGGVSRGGWYVVVIVAVSDRWQVT